MRGVSLAILDCILVATVALAALAVRANATRSFDEAVVLGSFKAARAVVEASWSGEALRSIWAALSGENGAQVIHESYGGRVELGAGRAGWAGEVYGEARALFVCYGATLELKLRIGAGV